MALPGTALFRAYWNLDEASGDALDATGRGHNLTETSGTIASASGGRDFEAGDTEYFIKADHADYSFADEAFTIGAWVLMESQTASQAFLGKWNYGSNKREYLLWYYQPSDRYTFSISDNGTNNTGLEADSYGNVPATTLALVLGWHDPVANTISIQVNNGTVDSAAYSTGCNDNSSALTIGCDLNGATPAFYYDGIMWSAFVYAGVMTADERMAMYNGGTPIKWSSILSAQLARLARPQIIII